MASRVLKIVQLACYSGNIGDNANLRGTRRLLRRSLPWELSFTDLDILDFLWGRRRFDGEFQELVNRHDLFIIGGGGFFELSDDQSATGTPLDFSRELLQGIRTPMVFHALGVDAAEQVPRERVERFRRFLDYLFSRPDVLVSIRNDGAGATVARLLGEEYRRRLHLVPDGGFFTEVKEAAHPELKPGRITVAINLAGDMLPHRFPGGESHLDFAGFLAELARALRGFLQQEPRAELVLVPHIFKDVAAAGALLSSLGVPYCRRRANLAPLLQGPGAQGYIFDLYRRCQLVLGMRFHANVCPLGLATPTLGLVCYPQIAALYRELELEDHALVVNRPGFAGPLVEMMFSHLEHSGQLKERYHRLQSELEDSMRSFHQRIAQWLAQHL